MTIPTATRLDGCAVLPPMEPRPRPLDTAQGNPAKRPAGRKATGNRFGVLNAFADYSMANLDRAEVVVWLLLYRDTKPNGLARTSQADLARRAGTAERTIGRAIGKLRKAGLLTVVRRGALSRGPSTYRVYPLANTPPPIPPDPLANGG